MPRGSVLVCLALLILYLPSHALGEESPPVISFFVVGGVDPATNPLTGYFMQDPQFEYTGEPVASYFTLEQKRRLDRLYYPRTRQILLDSYDMLILVDARLGHLPTSKLHDLDYAFREARMPAFTTFGLSWNSDWLPTILYDLVPVSVYENYQHRPYHLVFRRERDPVFTPFVELGMEKVMGGSYHVMATRQGSVVWADMVPMDLPFLVSWRPGGGNPGVIWTLSGAFDAAWWGAGGSWGDRGKNPFAIDFATNLIFYSLDRPLISDIQARREARLLLSSFQIQKLLILSVMDWADGLGANVGSVLRDLSELEISVQDATEVYLVEEYGSTILKMESVGREVERITGDAVRLKNEAMFWIFVSEWLVVTSVGILAGFVVWSLMIRRRLYRAVATTRLVEAGEP
jgi:hypothetical protein